MYRDIVDEDPSYISGLEADVRAKRNPGLNMTTPSSTSDIEDPSYISGLEADVRAKRNPGLNMATPGSTSDIEDPSYISGLEADVRAKRNPGLNMATPGSTSDIEDPSYISGLEADVRAKRNPGLNMATPGSTSDIEDPSYISGLEADVRAKRKEEASSYQKLNDVLTNGVPQNCEQLKEILTSINCREDYVKYLLDNEKQKLVNICYNVGNKYDLESSTLFNKAIFEYLAVINALIDMNVPHLSNKGAYDPYYVNLNLSELIQVVHIRRKNGADINIQIPKDYDFSNPQEIADLVNIINCTMISIDNKNISKQMWSKLGYNDKKNEEIEEEKNQKL
ncbi:MAG: hypothetical protein Q4E75_00430 [bacterium]|nr:hypothetical protein [bacterium]